jgi:septal ring factor EnvC (AmiA/AmiB activator)
MAQKQQETLFQKQQSQQRLLAEQNQHRLATIKELDSKLAQQSNRIANLKQEEEALQALFKQLEAQPTPPKPPSKPKLVQTQPKTQSNKKFSQLKGQLPWPIHGKVTARYGSAKNLGKLTWQGIMINAPSGDEVKATADGIVVFSGWLRGFGLLIIVDHGDKYMSLYGNNESLLKEVGETVSSGELIALSGDKGIRQHAGLYFEIRHKGSPTNPMTWLGKQS